MSTLFAVVGRIFIAFIFIVSGATKLMTVAATNAEIAAHGLPNGLAIPTGLFELIFGFCLVFGIATRITAILLAGFTALATLFFHQNLRDPIQGAMAMKNLAIIGGLFLVFAHSQMWWSYDSLRRARRNDRVSAGAARDAETRASDAEARARAAEVRAARLEGKVEGVDHTIG